MTATVSCTDCPLYIKAADAKIEGSYGPLQYFGMCRGTGRFINAAAAKSLPGTSMCPSVDADGSYSKVVATEMLGVFDSTAGEILDGTALADAPWRHDYARVTHAAEAGSGTAPSCANCVFFVEKGTAPGSEGTPLARFDSCGKLGTLVRPGSRAETAAACDVGKRGARNTYSTAILPWPAYRSVTAMTVATTVPAPAAPTFAPSTLHVEIAEAVPTAAKMDRAAAAARITTDAYDRLLDETIEASASTFDLFESIRAAASTLESLDDAAAAAQAEADAEAAAEAIVADAVAAAATATATDGKALPKRPKTGMVYDAATYAMPYALPEGAMGVIAVRSTSRASDVVWLPRYDEARYDEQTQRDVPSLDGIYIDHSDLLYRMAVAYLTDHVAALWGDAGVGKTEGVEHVARLTRQPFARISVKWATQVDDLIGRWALREGSMEWIDGRFTKAWRGGYIVCVDEPNCGKDEVWQALRAPFDGAKMLVLDEKDGERIPRHPQSRVFAAMNPSWDARFVGTQPVNDADLDRMQHITVPYPPIEVEREIMALKAPWVDADTADKMLTVARDIRTAVESQSIRISFGVRKMLKWADLLAYMGPVPAFRQAVTEWMQPREARLLTDIVDASF